MVDVKMINAEQGGVGRSAASSLGLLQALADLNSH